MKRYIKKDKNRIKRLKFSDLSPERQKQIMTEHNKVKNFLTGLEMFFDFIHNNYKDKTYKFKGLKKDAELFIENENGVVSINKIKNPGA